VKPSGGAVRKTVGIYERPARSPLNRRLLMLGTAIAIASAAALVVLL
jgi:hypothetical protein